MGSVCCVDNPEVVNNDPPIVYPALDVDRDLTRSRVAVGNRDTDLAPV